MANFTVPIRAPLQQGSWRPRRSFCGAPAEFQRRLLGPRGQKPVWDVGARPHTRFQAGNNAPSPQTRKESSGFHASDS